MSCEHSHDDVTSCHVNIHMNQVNIHMNVHMIVTSWGHIMFPYQHIGYRVPCFPWFPVQQNGTCAKKDVSLWSYMIYDHMTIHKFPHVSLWHEAIMSFPIIKNFLFPMNEPKNSLSIGCLIFKGYFPQKSPTIRKRALQFPIPYEWTYKRIYNQKHISESSKI